MGEGSAACLALRHLLRAVLGRVCYLGSGRLQLHPLVVHACHCVDRDQEAALLCAHLDEVYGGRPLPDVELLDGADLVAVFVEDWAAPGVLPVLIDLASEVIELDYVGPSL